MPHPRLVSFFDGAFEELLGAFRKIEGAPSACAGSLREDGLRRAIMHSLPVACRLFPGEIIDPFGGSTGQLDGVLVHSSGVGLATGADESRIVLAEGALAVVESKSDLSAQWPEVVRTWSAVREIRRYGEAPRGSVFVVRAPRQKLPFVVVGRHGWRTVETLLAKVRELRNMIGQTDEAPPLLIVQLDPPGLAVCAPGQEEGRLYDDSTRWRTLSAVWGLLSSEAQALIALPPDFAAYLSPAAQP